MQYLQQILTPPVYTRPRLVLITDGRIDAIQATQCFRLHHLVYAGWMAPMVTTCIQESVAGHTLFRSR